MVLSARCLHKLKPLQLACACACATRRECGVCVLSHHAMSSISARLDTAAHIPRVRHARRTLVDLKHNECVPTAHLSNPNIQHHQLRSRTSKTFFGQENSGHGPCSGGQSFPGRTVRPAGVVFFGQNDQKNRPPKTHPKHWPRDCVQRAHTLQRHSTVTSWCIYVIKTCCMLISSSKNFFLA